jgi:hypothetical protein
MLAVVKAFRPGWWARARRFGLLFLILGLTGLFASIRMDPTSYLGAVVVFPLLSTSLAFVVLAALSPDTWLGRFSAPGAKQIRRTSRRTPGLTVRWALRWRARTCLRFVCTTLRRSLSQRCYTWPWSAPRFGCGTGSSRTRGSRRATVARLARLKEGYNNAATNAWANGVLLLHACSDAGRTTTSYVRARWRPRTGSNRVRSGSCCKKLGPSVTVPRYDAAFMFALRHQE